MYRSCFLLLCFLFCFAGFSYAQLSLTQPGVTATMNFDVPGTSACSGTLPWTNNVTIPNCYTNRSVYAYSNGCNNTGAVHVAGSAGETAFGGRASTSTSLIIWGVRVVNNTGQAITALHIKYRAEQWALAESNLTNTVQFGYRVSATPITDVTTGTYTSEPALNMRNFVTGTSCGGGNSNLNGNLPAYSGDIYACIQVNIPDGHEIMLRWYEPNDNCNDHMLCIDDLEVTPVSGLEASVYNPPVCTGDSIRLSARPALQGAAYSWSGPGGFAAQAADTIFAPAVLAHEGVYTATTTIPGCGTLSDTVNVTIAEPITQTITDSICTGDFYVFANDTLMVAGTYTDTLKTSGGCDSVIILHLSLKQKPAAPQVGDTVYYCQFDAATTLLATGDNLRWYAEPDIILPETPVPSTDKPGIVTYYVSQVLNGCESEKTPVVVYVRPAHAAFVVQPEPVCADDTAVVTFTGDAPETALFNWYWDGGVVHSGSGSGPYHVSWSEPGVRHLRMQLDNGGCISKVDTVSILVRELPVAVLNSPASVCRDETIVLSVSGAENAAWHYDVSAVQHSKGQHTVTLSWTSSGDKQVGVSVTDQHGCTSPVTEATVLVHALPDARIARVDPGQVCVYDTALLEAAPGAGYIYTWQPGRSVISGQTQSEILLEAGAHPGPMEVWLTVTDEHNCVDRDTVTVQVVPCCDIYLPNAFTPNGDGKNDLFRIIAKGPQRTLDFRIFNRWGALVYATTKDKEGWDGFHNGRPAEMGSYYYQLLYDCDGSEKLMKGEVTLIR